MQYRILAVAACGIEDFDVEPVVELAAALAAVPAVPAIAPVVVALEAVLNVARSRAFGSRSAIVAVAVVDDSGSAKRRVRAGDWVQLA